MSDSEKKGDKPRKKESLFGKKGLKNVGIAFLYIIILLSLIYAIPQALTWILGTDHPMASITSRSMWPALNKGDLVLIKGVDNKGEIQVGDIIVYKNPKGFTIHRVIQIKENSLVTQGDANNVKDAAIKYEEVIGKALTLKGKPAKIPFLGNVSIWINR